MPPLGYLNAKGKKNFMSSKSTEFSFPVTSPTMAYDYLKDLMKKKGKSQAEFAKVLNKTPAVVTNMFNGERQLKLAEVVRVARWLEVSIDEVVGMPRQLAIPVIGEVGAGGEVYPIDDLPLIPRIVRKEEQDYINCDWVEAPPGIYPAG